MPEELPNQRIIYNNEKLRKYKANEIKILKKILKDKKSEHIKRMKVSGKKIKSFSKREKET